MKFTQTNVRSLKPPIGKADITIWDEAMAGFGIRFRNGGAGAFVIQYQIGERQAKMTLGKVAKVELEQAQIEAKQHFAMIAKKIDPAVERAKVMTDNEQTFEPLIDPFIAFLERKGRSAGYVKWTRRCLTHYMTDLHRRPVKGIERADISRELRRITAERGPVSSKNSRAALSKFFSWIIGEGLAHHNPVDGTNKEEAGVRDRVLTPEEIVCIWNESGEGDYGKIIKLLILTAVRKSSIGNLSRKELLFDKAMLDLPKQRNKNKERFLVPLSRQALAILSSVTERKESPFVFGEGEGGFSGWSKCKERLDGRLGEGFEHWVHHDFRRTFETLGKDVCKIPPHVTDVCLHHVGEARKGVKRHYNYANYLDEKRSALQVWADYIDGLVNKKVELRIAA